MRRVLAVDVKANNSSLPVEFIDAEKVRLFNEIKSRHVERVMTDELRLDRYFERIGFVGPIKPDLTTLSAIQAAHVNAIPFEGLDPLLRRPVKLDMASLQHKLLASRRGGYCFEQNAVLRGALEAVGFKVTGLGARVRWMSQADSPLGPKIHMLLKVDLPDGPYIADAGFGACMLDAPLRLEGQYRAEDSDGHLPAHRGRRPVLAQHKATNRMADDVCLRLGTTTPVGLRVGQLVCID